MKNREHDSTGITFGGLLQIALIVLKLCHAINWSWWFVLLPSWIGVAVFIIAVIVLYFVYKKKG